jgi:putative phage-type endonuclease
VRPYVSLPFKANTPEWLAAKKELGIGASEAAAACGLSSYRTPFDVYSWHAGLSVDTIQTEQMEWGHLLEGPVAMYGARKLGIHVRRGGSLLQSIEWPWMVCTPDYWAGKDLIQIKTANAFARDFGEEGTDQVPQDYLLQEQHEMAVTGASRAHLWVLLGGQKFRHFLIPRDYETIIAIVELERRLWQERITPGVPPDLDGSEGASAFLAARYAESNGLTVEATEDVQAWGLDYLAAIEAAKVAEAAKVVAAQKIQDFLGENVAAQGGDIIVRWTPVKESTYTVTRKAGRRFSVDHREA